MPNIDNIQPVLYTGSMPYHVDYDNLPLTRILARQNLLNLSVEQYTAILKDSVGSAGSLSNRLAQSINDDGSLKVNAINESLHNIGYHSDGNYDGIDYVRMKLEEREKLELIDDEANSLKIKVGEDTLDNGTLEILDTDTISWTYEAPNKISAEFAFPTSAAHEHHYGLTPVHSNISTPNYINYKTTSVSTPFIEDSLKVFINGIRIFEDVSTYVYTYSSGPSGSWTSTNFTANHLSGTFYLNRAISASDIIKIDFDRSLT